MRSLVPGLYARFHNSGDEPSSHFSFVLFVTFVVELLGLDYHEAHEAHEENT